MLVKHSLIYLIVRVASGAVNFAAIALYSRLLSPEAYGLYALTITSIALIYSLLFQWLRESFLRFSSKSPDRDPALIATVVSLYATLTIAVGIISFVLFNFTTASIPSSLYIFAILLLWAQSWYGLNLELARSQLLPTRYGVLWFGRGAIALVIGGTLAHFGFGSSGLLVGSILGALIPSLLLLKSWRELNLKDIDFALIKPLLIYGLPLSVNLALEQIIMNSDRILLQYYVGVSAVGIYAIGYDLTWQVILMMTMAVNTAALPLVFRKMEQEGVEAARMQLSLNLDTLLLIALPLVVGISMVATNFAQVFLGSDFSDGVAMLIPWIAFSVLLYTLKIGYTDLAFQLRSKTAHQVWVAATSAAINFLFNLLWIPKFGMLGAAYSTALAFAVALVFSYILGNKILTYPALSSNFWKILLATAGMAVSLIPFNSAMGIFALALKAIGGGFIYILLLIVLNVLESRTKSLALWQQYIRIGTS